MKNLCSIMLVMLSLFSCSKEKRDPWIHTCMEDVQSYYKKGNIEYALNSCRVIKENIGKADSMPFWPQTMAGEAELFMRRGDLENAKRDYKDLLDFARRRKLIDRECVAWQCLGQIALLQKRSLEADSCYRKAIERSFLLPSKKLALPYLKEEALIASSVCEIMDEPHGVIPDSVYQDLLILRGSRQLELRVATLKLLLVYGAQTELSNDRKGMLISYLQANDSLTSRRFASYASQMKQEKVQLILEHDREATAKQRTQFISLFILALVLSGGTYGLVSNRRKREVDRVHQLLAQKEKEFTSLEHRSHELNEMRALLQNKEQQLGELEEKCKELDVMRDRTQRKQEELKALEQHFREARFYELEWGSRIPAPGNPNTAEEFDALFCKEENCEAFLREVDQCFNGFVSRLHRLTPKLSREDLVYCCLFRLEVRPSDIALMFCVSRTTVSMRRKRIEEKLAQVSKIN